MLFLFLSILPTPLRAQIDPKKEAVNEVLDIKLLEGEVEDELIKAEIAKRKKLALDIEKAKDALERQKFVYPDQDTFYDIFNQYWLVKNRDRLKWDEDFAQSDLNQKIEDVFKAFSFNKFYKILFVKDDNLSIHLLPCVGNTAYFLVSYDFLFQSQLNAKEASILFLEELILSRMRKNKLPSYSYEGQDFKETGFDKELMTTYMRFYDQQLLKPKVSLQEGYELFQHIYRFLEKKKYSLQKYLEMLEKARRSLSFRRYKPGHEFISTWAKKQKVSK